MPRHPELQEQIDHLQDCHSYDVIAVPRKRYEPTPQQQKKDSQIDGLTVLTVAGVASAGVLLGFHGLNALGAFETPNEQLASQNNQLNATVASQAAQIEVIQGAVCKK